MNLKELDSFSISDAISFHDELNPNLWDGQQLQPKVKQQLLHIAKDFLEELGVSDLDVDDITVSGSNAAYSYTPHSDLDLHILVDLSKLDNDEIYRELFNAKKTIYNDTHNITIHGVPVELYVQDSREPVVSLGEYSILKDKWLRIPTKRRANLDQTATKQKYTKLLDIIRRTLKSKNIVQVSKAIQKIKQYRKAGLDKGGEFGPENLAYKILRKQGLIDKLYNLRDKLHSEHLTIEDYHPNGPPPGPEFKPTMPAGTVRVDVSDVYDWYKLGQHISNMKGLGKHDFGKGPPSTIMAFGSEPEEHKYIQDLEKTGLTTTDIDPIDKNQPKGMKRQKVDPTYNVSEVVNPDVTSKNYFIEPTENVRMGDFEFNARTFTGGLGNPNARGLQIRAYDPRRPKGNNLIGSADFIVKYDKKGNQWLESDDTEVNDEYRGKGVAAMMYAFAKSLGNDIKASPYQSQKGREMWSKWGKDAEHLVSESQDYMSGHCHVMALALKKLHPDWKIRAHIGWDEEAEDDSDYRVDHVYIVSPDGSAYDCRGKFNSEEELVGPDETGGVETQMIDYGFDDIKNDVSRGELKSFSKDDLLNAVQFIKKQNVIESFDKPYKLKWEKGEHGDYDALATLDDGTYLSIMFNNEYKNTWMVEFYRNNSQEVTGEGDAQRIFATVLMAIGQFIKKKKPVSLFFSAVKEDDPKGSRARLYNTLVNRYATELGYSVTTRNDDRGMSFKLTRQVNEASGYIPSEKEKNDPRFKTALTIDIKPDSIKKNAKAFNWKTSRAGIPPNARPDGKFL